MRLANSEFNKTSVYFVCRIWSFSDPQYRHLTHSKMPISSDKLQEFTIKAANQSQIELHAKASYVIWPRAQSYEVSRGSLHVEPATAYNV